MKKTLPYRPAAAVMLLNSEDKVFVAQRIDSQLEAWLEEAHARDLSFLEAVQLGVVDWCRHRLSPSLRVVRSELPDVMKSTTRSRS